MFGWWHRVRDGTLARSTFRVYMRTVQRRVESLLAEGAAVPHFKTSRTCAKLLKRADALWIFLYVEGVEPTNNTAERAERRGVLCRKTSYGTHSEEGRRFVERILSVHATLRQQRRNVLHFVYDACRAALRSTGRLPLRSSPSSSTTSRRHNSLSSLSSLRRAVNGYQIKAEQVPTSRPPRRGRFPGGV